MRELLVRLDQELFFAINRGAQNPVTDLVMPVITNDWLLRIMLGAGILLMLIKGNSKMRWYAIGGLLLVALVDQTSSKLLKPLIDRPRPCHELEAINLLVNCGAGKSMPSSHAANTFAVAGYFSSLFSGWSLPLVLFAAGVALSRVFVGVHYPGDILVGGLLGLVIGRLFAHLVARLTDLLHSGRKGSNQEEAESAA